MRGVVNRWAIYVGCTNYVRSRKPRKPCKLCQEYKLQAIAVVMVCVTFCLLVCVTAYVTGCITVCVTIWRTLPEYKLRWTIAVVRALCFARVFKILLLRLRKLRSAIAFVGADSFARIFKIVPATYWDFNFQKTTDLSLIFPKKLPI